MPSAPAKKQPINVKVAALGDKPPLVKYVFAEGSMLYNAENIYSSSDDENLRDISTHTMTPKERLSPVDKNVLLSSILKFFMPGKRRMMRSTHIIDAVAVSLNSRYQAS